MRISSLPAALALVFFFLFSWSASGMHIIGGEITYRYLGEAGAAGKRYEFTMKVYRDCFGGGANFDIPANFAIYRGTENSNSIFATFSVSNPVITRLVPDTPACVANVPVVCVEQAIYTFERILPVTTTESYFIVYQRCCRNLTIANIFNPGDIGATYAVELTAQAQAANNSSPVYNNFPPIIICNGFALTFDHSATDADGDQLVYRFCSPLAGGGPVLSPPSALNSCFGAQPIPPCAPPFDEVPFIVPNYSPSSPMGGNPAVTINSVSGLVTGTPNILGQFVVAVCVEEYRNGQLLSVIRREFQFNVTDCSPTVLAGIAADSIAGPRQFVLTSCGSNTLTLTNLSVQEQNINRFSWEFDLKGVPYVDTTNWNPTITFPDTGFYTGALYLNPGQLCGDTAYINVNIFPGIEASFYYDYDTCVAGPVVFTDESTGEGGINRWSWQFGVPNGTSNEQNPEYLYAVPGNHNVRLRVYDQNNCSDDSVQVINWFPVPPLIIIEPNTFIGCAPAEIFFNNLSSPIDSTYTIEWNFGDGTVEEGTISPTYIYTEEGTYTVSVAITSPIGCYTTDTFTNLIRVEPSPIANFSYLPDSSLSNFNSTVQFFDQSSGAYRWNWQFDRFGTSVQQNPSFHFPDTGSMAVRLIVTHPQGCKDSLTRYLDFMPEIRWFMPNAFSPNGDGQNDNFLGNGLLEGVNDFRMTIWNRYGEMVFETTNPQEGWSGRDSKSGDLSPVGVYVYLVTFTAPRGQAVEYRGFATLLR